MSEYNEKPDPTRAESERIWDIARKQVREEYQTTLATALNEVRQAVASQVLTWMRVNLPSSRRLTAAQETALRRHIEAGPESTAPTPD